jgi:hypothetical protein
VGLALVVVSLVVPEVGLAKRLAGSREKQAIFQALTSPPASCSEYEGRRSCSSPISKGIPERCTKIYVATVNSNWGSETDVSNSSA